MPGLRGVGISGLAPFQPLQTQWQGPAVTAPTLAADSAELQLVADGPFSLRLADSVHLDWDGQRLTLQRPSLRDGQPEYRYWRGSLQQLTLLLDRPSLEIFINDGETVMSSRIFPRQPAQLQLQGESFIQLQHAWQPDQYKMHT